MPSTACAAAIKAAVCPCAPQCGVYALMSASDGIVRPFSILLHFDSCQPDNSANARAVRPDSLGCVTLARIGEDAWALADSKYPDAQPLRFTTAELDAAGIDPARFGITG